MLSSRKTLLHQIEFVAITYSIGSMTAGMLVFIGVLLPGQIEPFAIAQFLFVWVLFIFSILLAAEFTRAYGLTEATRAGLTGAQVGVLIRWCPQWLKIASVLCGMLSGVILFLEGRVRWVSGMPFNEHHAIATCFGLSVFLSIAVPVIASARRMPNTFSVHAAIDRRSRRAGKVN